MATITDLDRGHEMTILAEVSGKLLEAYGLITQAGELLIEVTDPDGTHTRDGRRMVADLSKARQTVADVESTCYRAVTYTGEVEYMPATCLAAQIGMAHDIKVWCR